MLYVSPCLVLLSLLRSWLREWAKRRNTLLGPKLGSDIATCFLRLGGGSRSGEFIELSVLRSPGAASQKTGAAHGPRHPSCHNNQTCWVCSCCFGVVYERICGIGVQPILGCFGDESPSTLPFKLWPLYGSDRHLYSEYKCWLWLALFFSLSLFSLSFF